MVDARTLACPSTDAAAAAAATADAFDPPAAPPSCAPAGGHAAGAAAAACPPSPAALWDSEDATPSASSSSSEHEEGGEGVGSGVDAMAALDLGGWAGDGDGAVAWGAAAEAAVADLVRNGVLYCASACISLHCMLARPRRHNEKPHAHPLPQTNKTTH